MRRTSLLITGVLALSATMTGCTYNEATGRTQFVTMSREEEIALGTQATPELTKEYGGEVNSAELRKYVENVGERLVKHVEADYKNLPWEFTVLDSDVINAFALPGGKVFISRGLLAYFNDEAEVAGVLGHEIGHVTSQHVDERISHAMAVQGVGNAILVAVGNEGGSFVSQALPAIIGYGGQGYLLKFGRDQESEADIQGLKYMTAAGYDPHGMREVLEVLQEASAGNNPPEFLSTHPHPETRIKTVDRLLKEKYAYTQGNPEFKTYEERFQREAKPHLPAPKPEPAGQ